MVGFSFSIVTSWTALSGVLIIGVESGGPPVMVWGWLAVCVFTLAVAYSMAEMCSAYPVAGGQYSWVAILAPQRWARGFSYICGWFMLIGILAMGATNNFVAANFILGTAQLNNPSYTIERWHTVLVAYLIAVVATVSNIFGPHLLDRISKGILVWNITAFFVCFITILACNDHKQSASFVFSDFQNATGFGAAYTAVLGLLQSAFGMCCYDAPSHMTEEIVNARKEAPRAIVLAVYIGSITGFIFLISLSFCMGSLESTAGTPTGVPVIEIFYNSTGSIAGSSVLSSLIIVIVVVCANSLMAEGSRAVYAFARDHGLPFSGTLSKVWPKTHVPVNALLLTFVVQIAFNSIYFGTLTGFNTVIAIATEGFYLSYAMPLLARILAYFSGNKQRLEGPYSLGRYSLALNTIGFLFLTFCCITFNFPSVSPVDSENMNYTSAAIGVVMLISLITWITTGRKRFTGPDSGHLLDEGRGAGEVAVGQQKAA
ncbi:amino acid transporter [Amniculicola lignicola CBS 123094]|uniref:Amino acid transporter n=1 Tax=Amniculicola lignicola CBS 123094 TaxID=1392246 RepID=A0A6A5X1F3_9PLEO|nr:amino acid transporter [Amniculicola lignicola CBS 123094]